MTSLDFFFCIWLVVSVTSLGFCCIWDKFIGLSASGVIMVKLLFAKFVLWLSLYYYVFGIVMCGMCIVIMLLCVLCYYCYLRNVYCVYYIIMCVVILLFAECELWLLLCVWSSCYLWNVNYDYYIIVCLELLLFAEYVL